MLNRVCIQGRLTKEPEVKNTSNQTAYANFTLACDRPYKNDQGKFEADFINCTAWRQTALFIGQYFNKGDQIVVSGRLQTRSYEDNSGSKVKVTEVVVDEASFCGGNKPASKPQDQTPPPAPSDEPLPFDI